MTSIIKSIEKLFQPKYKNLDAKFWVQKLILKKKISKKLTLKQVILINSHQI